MSKSIKSWSEYYSTPEILPNISGVLQIDQFRNAENGNIYIYDIIFTGIAETQESGGAISIISESKILIEMCSFFHCHSVGQGGAIFINNIKSKSAIKMVCSTRCSSNSEMYQFCVTCIENNANSMNCMDYSSVVNTYSSLSMTTRFVNGNISLNYNNISKNNCDYWSALVCTPFKREDDIFECYISYSSFENNTSTVSGVIGLDNLSNRQIVSCNIIGNNAKDGDNGVVLIFGGLLEIINSCLIENNINSSAFCPHYDNKTFICLINCTSDNNRKADEFSGTVIVKKPALNSFRINLQNERCFTKSKFKIEKKPCVQKTEPNIFKKYNSFFRNSRLFILAS